MPSIFADLRYAMRMRAKAPGVTATIIGILALGIGANTAIFTVANALLLRPLPYAHPEQLVLAAGSDFQDGSRGTLSYPFFTLVNEKNRSFSSLSACIFENFNLTGRGDPEQVPAARVSWNFFDALGVRPASGRGFLPDEDRPGARQVVVLSSEFAARLFADPHQAVGQNLTLDSSDYTVVGVLPSGFVFSLFGPRRDIWAPRVTDMSLITPARVALGGPYFNVIGRLQPGVSREQARAELDILYRRYKRDKPGNFDAGLNMVMRVESLQGQLVADVRPALLILSAAVALVLFIACANVAGLLLSRAIGRQKEFAVRTALGAPRTALIRQLLAESVLLATTGGGLGILLGAGGTRALIALSQDNLQSADLSIHPVVLAFALLLSVGCGILFGLSPALQLSKADISTGLRDGGRGSSDGRRRTSLRSALVVGQVALSMMLLVGSGLLIQSFARLRNAAPGFDPQGILTMHISLPTAKYARPPQMIAFYDEVLRRVRSLPGVEAVSLATALPMSPTHLTPMLFEGQTPVALGKRPIVNIQQISPGYSKVLRVPLTSGRMFTESDTDNAPKVAIVNQATCRRFWPNQNALGKKVWIGRLEDPFEVIGVIGDLKNNGLATPPGPEVLLPYPQLPAPYLELNVRTAIEPHSALSAVRAQIAAVDRDQPVTDVRTMQEFVESLSSQRRFTMMLLAAFAATAFLLATLGLYGLIAYSVVQRRRELGIRIALGADRSDILRLVVGNGLVLTTSGIAIGIALALALSRLISGMLYETSALDPIVFLASALAFVGVAVTASYLPARLAARVDATEALRAE